MSQGNIDRDSQRIRKSDDTIINPATEEKQDTANTLLTTIDSVLDSIFASVDGLEANTDEIEAKLEDVKTKLDTLAAKDFSTETTLAAFKAEAKSESDATQSLLTTIDTVLDNILSKATELDAAFDAEDFAQEATLSNLSASVGDETDAEAATGDGSLVAILKAIRTKLGEIDANTDGLEAVDYATETTLSALLTKLTELDNAFDAEDFATAANQATIIGHVDGIEALLTSLDGKDFATETTLSAFSTATNTNLNDIEADIESTNTRIGEVSATPTANTMLGRLKDIYEAVDGLELSIDNIDLDMDDVEALLTTIDGVLDNVLAKLTELDTAFDERNKRISLPDLSITQTLTASQSYSTVWVPVKDIPILIIDAEVPNDAMYSAVLEFTNAADPNTTPPGANDVVRPLITTIAGTDFGGIANPVFHIPAAMDWARLTVTDMSGGQTVIIDTEASLIDPGAPQLPVIATITDDFRAPIGRSIGLGRQPDGDYVNTPADGEVFQTTTPLGIDEEFVSDWYDSDQWRSIEIVIATDAPSATDGIVIEYTDNAQATTPTVRTSRKEQFGQFDVTEGSLVLYAPTELDGFRVRYKNDGMAQSSFFLATTMRTTQVEAPRSRGGGIVTSNPWRTVFKDTSQLSGALPSGSVPAFDKVGPIQAANVIDTGWLNSTDFKDQLLTLFFDCSGVEVYLMNATDSQGNNSPTAAFDATASRAISVANAPVVAGAPFFSDYFRIVIINASGQTCNEWGVRSKGGDTPPGPVFQSINQPILDFFPAPLTQTILKAQRPNGVIDSVQADSDGDLFVSSRQITDPDNTVVITSASPAGHVPGTPWVGSPFETRGRSIQENLTTVAASDAAGNPLSSLGGTFTFRFYADDGAGNPGTVLIKESVTIRSFGTVRNIGWLSNAGEFYEAEFEPDRALVAGETVYVTTIHSKVAGNDFKRLTDQVLEKENSVLSQTFAIIKGFDINGDSKDVPVPTRDDSNSTITPLNGNETFRGVWREWQGKYIGMSNEVKSDVSGTLILDFSTKDSPADGVDTDVDFTITRPYDPSELIGTLRRVTPVQSRWVRIRYVNDGTAQTSFSLETSFLTAAVPEVLESVIVPPFDSALAGIERTIEYSRDDSGEWKEIKQSPNGGKRVSVVDMEAEVPLKALDQLNTGQGTVLSTGAVPIPSAGTGLTNRKSIEFSNHSNTINVYYGNSPAVTTLNGKILRPGADTVLELDESVDFYWIADDTGGTTQISNQSFSTASGTATSPSNVLTNDGAHASFTTGQNVVADTPSYTKSLENINALRICVEGRKQPSVTTETVTFQEAQVGETNSGNSVSSASLAGGTDQLYIVAITRNDLNSISGVSGAGLTFQAEIINQSAGGRHLDVWYAFGDADPGAITATMSTNTRAQISVIRVSGASAGSIVQASGTTTGTGSSVTGPALNKTANGLGFMAVSHEAASASSGTGYTERSDETNGTGSNTVSLATVTKTFATTGNESATMTLSGSSDWVAIGLTITPATAKDITFDVEYNEGAGYINAGSVTLTSTTDTSYYVDITSTHTLTEGAINATEVRLTRTGNGAAAGEIDHVFLEVTEGSADTAARISYAEVADTEF